MIDESFAAKRMRGLNIIVNSLQMIDEYNLNHNDAKILDFDKLVTEVMKEFSIKESTAVIWCTEAKRIHEYNHNANLSHETYLRNNKLIGEK